MEQWKPDTREDLLSGVRDMRQSLTDYVAEAGDRIEQPGSFQEWSFKDLIAHLTGWRLVTASRLEAGLNGAEPEFPWPGHLKEGDEDLDEINQWFYETNRDKPVSQVIEESNDTFDRIEHALAEMPEDDLFMPNRFDWLYWTREGLGPAVIRGSMDHYWVEHEPDIRKWITAS